MADKLELKVVFSAIDNFLRPVKAITQSASTAAKAFRENTARLKELNRTVEQIDAFKKLEKDAAITANAFRAAQDRLAQLKEQMRGQEATAQMTRAFMKASKEVDSLRNKHQALMQSQQHLFSQMKAGGIDTSNLAEQRQRLSSASAEATNASRKLSAALDAENQKMRRLHAARADLAKTTELRNKIAVAGAGMTAGGVAVGLPVGKATKDFADYETAMLGVARQVDGARDANGKLTATYYEIGEAVKALSERLPGTANDIAAIVTAGARMGIQGKQNLLTFAETTAVMASAFDLPVEQIGEDMGKISQIYKVPIKDIKALGDTINWLDDNAQSKGADIIDVMKRIAGNATAAGMSYKEAAALGSTFLSLGAGAEVAASASNAMIRELSIATMQSKRFREGAAMLNLDLKALQKSASIDPTGTIIRVMEAINKLPKESQIEAATRMFGKEFGDDAAKLATNLDEYRKQLKLVNDEKARGSMGRESDQRNLTLNERMGNAKDALTNLSSDLGKHLQPELVATLEKTLSIVQGIRDWSKENPQLAAGIMTTVKWLAVALTVIGGLTLAAAAVLGPLAMLKFSMVTLGISGSGLAAALAGGLNWVLIAVGKAGEALLWLGRLAMGHPILAMVTLLAGAALYVWQNWDTLGPKFFALVDRISGYFGGLKDRAIETGRQMIDGMKEGISSRWDALKASVTGIGDAAIGWFKEKLGIHSPSRVFAELGGFTMQGFEQGLTDSMSGPLGAASSLAKQLAGIGAGLTIGGVALAQAPIPVAPPDLPALRNDAPLSAISGMAKQLSGIGAGITIDDRTPARRPASADSRSEAQRSDTDIAAPMQVTINIHGAPGQDTAAIQRAVEQALANAEARNNARQRSRLRDME